MKNLINVVSTCILLICVSNPLQAQHSLEPIWNSGPVFKFSEGVIPSADGKFLYVSNTIGSPMAKDGEGSISTVSLDGKIINADWVTGMNAPKGIQRYKNLIFTADLDEVVVVDIEKAAIVNRIKIEGASLLHQFAIDKNGVVYVSDMFAGKVYKIENGKPSLYLENLGYAAGLLLKGTDLYIVSAGKLLKADKNKNITTVSEGMDERGNGVQMVKDNEFLVTCWSGLMYYVNADGSNQVLLDNREQQIPCGIMYYNPEKKIVYMTSDQHNVLFAYRVK